MIIEKNTNSNTMEIWVDNSESSSYKQMQQYIDAIEQSKRAGFDVCVYVGGNEPLTNNIAQMMKLN